MEKDNEINDSMVDDEPTQQGSHNGDIEGSSDGIEERTLIFLDGQLTSGTDDPIIDKTETTNAGEEGLEEITQIKIKSASCGHVLHTSAEAGLACNSCRRLHKEALVLCTECAKNPANVCYICNAPCCYQCRDERWLDGQMRIVCKACIRSTLRLRILKAIIKWLLILAGLYYLVRF